jgi:undecaprenyl-diphosphatase
MLRLAAAWIGLLALALAAGFVLKAHGGPDWSALQWVLRHRSIGVRDAAKQVTNLGGTLFLTGLFVVTVAALAMRGRNRDALLVALASPGMSLMVSVVKSLVARPRPAGEHLVHVITHSWPSGHAADSAALYGILAVLLARDATRGRRIALWAGTLVLVAAIGATRPILGVHYLSDVAGGWILAALWVTAVVRALQPRNRAPSGSQSGSGTTSPPTQRSNTSTSTRAPG